MVDMVVSSVSTKKIVRRIFLMVNGDHISTAQTGDNSTSRSESVDANDKPTFEVPHATTPSSSIYSGDMSQTSSALGRLMEYVCIIV